MTSNPTHPERLEHLRKIVNSAHSGMFVTHTLEGLHGRPMATAEVAESCEVLYFATSRHSAKIDELKHDSRIFLSYQKGATEWATINGAARVLDDRAKIHELWSPMWKNWFEGPNDPSLVLIEVTPDKGEYWDSGNKVLAMVKFAIGAVTGKNMDKSDNQKVAI